MRRLVLLFTSASICFVLQVSIGASQILASPQSAKKSDRERQREEIIKQREKNKEIERVEAAKVAAEEKKNNDALGAVRSRFDQVFAKCGEDRYLIQHVLPEDTWKKEESYTLYKVRNLRYEFGFGSFERLDEADHLNRIDWKGSINIKYDAISEFDNQNKKWGAWETYGHVVTQFSYVRAELKDGIWSTSPSPVSDSSEWIINLSESHKVRLVKLTCGKVDEFIDPELKEKRIREQERASRANIENSRRVIDDKLSSRTATTALGRIKGVWEFYWPQNEENGARRVVTLEVGDDKITLKANGDELVEQRMTVEKREEGLLLIGANPQIVDEAFKERFPAPRFTPDQLLIQQQPDMSYKIQIRDNVNIKEWQAIKVTNFRAEKEDAKEDVRVWEVSHHDLSGTIAVMGEKGVYWQFSRYNNTQKMSVKEIDGIIYLTGYDVLVSESNYRPFRYTADQLRFKPKSNGTFEIETRDEVNVKDWVPVQLKSYKEK